MAVDHPYLTATLESLTEELAAVGMARRRGGRTLHMSWAEASGRFSANQSWLELRLAFRELTSSLHAGLIEYLPISRGGRSINHGSTTIYLRHDDPPATAYDLAEAVRPWLLGLAGLAAIAAEQAAQAEAEAEAERRLFRS